MSNRLISVRLDPRLLTRQNILPTHHSFFLSPDQDCRARLGLNEIESASGNAWLWIVAAFKGLKMVSLDGELFEYAHL